MSIRLDLGGESAAVTRRGAAVGWVSRIDGEGLLRHVSRLLLRRPKRTLSVCLCSEVRSEMRIVGSLR